MIKIYCFKESTTYKVVDFINKNQLGTEFDAFNFGDSAPMRRTLWEMSQRKMIEMVSAGKFGRNGAPSVYKSIAYFEFVTKREADLFHHKVRGGKTRTEVLKQATEPEFNFQEFTGWAARLYPAPFPQARGAHVRAVSHGGM